MVYSASFLPQLLNQQQVGVPDYVGSLQKGMEAGNAPKKMASDLLGAALKQKYDAFKATPEYQGAMLDFLHGQGARQWAETNKLNRELDPYAKMQLEMQLALNKDDAIAKQKEARSIEQDLPGFEKNIKNARRLQEIATNHPEFFGPGAFGLNNAFTGAPKRARSEIANNPEYGEWNTLLTPFIAETARGLSSKPLALSLNTAIGSKPSFEEQQKSAIGKIQAMTKTLEEGREQARAQYKKLTGKDLASSTYFQSSIAGKNANQGISNEMKGVPQGKIRLYLNGKPHLIPVNLANRFLRQPGASVDGK